MTNLQAIKILLKCSKQTIDLVYFSALYKGIDALKKQTPKKVINANGFIYCPSCKKLFGTLFNMSCVQDKDKYCQNCGQKLNWGKI